jgi:hypothetical protein
MNINEAVHPNNRLAYAWLAEQCHLLGVEITNLRVEGPELHHRTTCEVLSCVVAICMGAVDVDTRIHIDPGCSRLTATFNVFPYERDYSQDLHTVLRLTRGQVLDESFDMLMASMH